MSNSTSTPNTGLLKDAGSTIEAGDAIWSIVSNLSLRTTTRSHGRFRWLLWCPMQNSKKVMKNPAGFRNRWRREPNYVCIKSKPSRHDWSRFGGNVSMTCWFVVLNHYFPDYYATGHLNVDVAANVVTGIGKGCGTCWLCIGQWW